MRPSSPKPPLTVAIDGPAAAGKSSVARAVAARLGLAYVDTGAMYRALTLKALRRGVDPEDGEALAQLAAGSALEFRPSEVAGRPQGVWLDGHDVTREIRTRDVDTMVSVVSRHPAVREWFWRVQQAMAKLGGVVMEGRDIGTVVLPGADVKIFLDASLEQRARRRLRELLSQGYVVEEESVREDMARRDILDTGRETAPLCAATDAVRIDSTGLTLAEVIDVVTGLCQRRRGAP